MAGLIAGHMAGLIAALGLVGAGCGNAAGSAAPTPPSHEVTTATATATAQGAASEAPRGEPVPAVVATLHERAFERPGAEALGGVLCFITLHDEAHGREGFFPLVLFANGSVATWREAPTGPVEPFSAKLGDDERTRAAGLVASLPDERALARQRFAPGARVMGVTLRVGERRETLYYEAAHMPEPLSRLIGMLKHRLEATNQKR